MPSGKRAKQQRRAAAATAVRTPPPVRSKSVGGVRGPRGARQASPRVLALAGVAVVAVIVAIVLAVELGGGGTKPTVSSDVPKTGSATWTGALPGAVDVRKLFQGIPQTGLVLGAPNAPATMTTFIDLQCPLCRQFETQQLPTIVKKYVRTGKLDVKMEPWSILDRPGTPPDSSRGQAATIAASLQNKGFQFAEMLYLNQGQEDSGWLTDNMVQLAAASVDGMDVPRVLSDMNGSGVKSIVHDVDSTASTDKFTGTPTILLNHKGKSPQVVSVGVPNPSTLQSQIETAIRG